MHRKKSKLHEETSETMITNQKMVELVERQREEKLIRLQEVMSVSDTIMQETFAIVAMDVSKQKFKQAIARGKRNGKSTRQLLDYVE